MEKQSTSDALRERIGELANELAALSRGATPPSKSAKLSAAMGRKLLQAHMTRRVIFGDLSFDPGWELLLTIYVAHLDHSPAVLSRIGKQLSYPFATVKRYVARLEEDGLIARNDDGYRRPIVMTEAGIEAMERYTAHLNKSGLAFG